MADEPREVVIEPGAGQPAPQEPDRRQAGWKYDLKWAAALLLAAVLGFAGWNNSLWQETPRGREDIGSIAELILSENALVLLLQLVGILLVAALVAAVVIAMRDPEPGEETEAPEHYNTEGYTWRGP